jgi:hypothetical protein
MPRLARFDHIGIARAPAHRHFSDTSHKQHSGGIRMRPSGLLARTSLRLSKLESARNSKGTP